MVRAAGFDAVQLQEGECKTSPLAAARALLAYHPRTPTASLALTLSFRPRSNPRITVRSPPRPSTCVCFRRSSHQKTTQTAATRSTCTAPTWFSPWLPPRSQRRKVCTCLPWLHHSQSHPALTPNISFPRTRLDPCHWARHRDFAHQVLARRRRQGRRLRTAMIGQEQESRTS